MTLRVLHTVLIASLAACSAPSDEPADTGIAGSTTPASLPLLACTPLWPVRDADEFASQGEGSYEYPSQQQPFVPTGEEPYGTDADATRAAIDWVVAHFGPLPADTALAVEDIDRSASGHEHPVYDWDRGHTIVLHQTYRGLATDRRAVIYIQGRSRFRGVISLARFSPIAGSERPTISKEAVLATVRQVMAQQGNDPAKIDAECTGLQPFLLYVWSPTHNASGGNREILAPNWALNPGGSALVDAQTGQPWRNG